MRKTHSSFILQPSSPLRGFTLVELLVVISIIAVLVGILVPVVGKIRKSSQEAATRALLSQIDAACQAYFSDFSAYPGPLSHGFMTMSEQSSTFDSSKLRKNNFADDLTDGAPTAGWNGFQANVERLTGTENLVLGLSGGLQQKLRPGTNPPEFDYGFSREDVGLGAVKFNPKRPGRANAYMQPTNLSEGKFRDDAGSAKDTDVPEYIDSFSNPMPILYLRARKGGAASNPASMTDADNNVVSDRIAAQAGQYNILEIAAYTQSTIGVGRSISAGDYKRSYGASPLTYPHGLIAIDTDSTLGSKTAASEYPYNAYAYLMDPSSNDSSITNANDRAKKHQARKKDQFILISAGIDRVYGTADDITNFGDVLP